jgi:hypothetical protein
LTRTDEKGEGRLGGAPKPGWINQANSSSHAWGGVDVEELSSNVRPACGCRDALLIKASVAGVTIRPEDTLKPGEMGFRMLALAMA